MIEEQCAEYMLIFGFKTVEQDGSVIRTFDKQKPQTLPL